MLLDNLFRVNKIHLRILLEKASQLHFISNKTGLDENDVKFLQNNKIKKAAHIPVISAAVEASSTCRFRLCRIFKFVFDENIGGNVFGECEEGE